MIALKIIAALNHSNRALTLRELSKQINEPDLQILKELLVLHKKRYALSNCGTTSK